MDRPDVPQDFLRAGTEELRANRADAFQRVCDRSGLLEDLLLHEVAVWAELHRIARGLHGHDLPRRARTSSIEHGIIFQRDVRNIAFFEIHNALGHGRKGCGIGREEMIVLADADQERTAGARADDASRLARSDRGNRVSALEFSDGLAHRGEQVAGVVRMDQVGNDLGVGLCDKAVTLALQPLA